MAIPPIHPSVEERAAIDGRMIALMRLILASSALVIIYLDPSEPNRLVVITYSALILYTLYSAGLLILVRRGNLLSAYFAKWSHWIDAGWYLLLISLSSGTSSIFFFFFFFSILTASFSWGFASGVRVAIVSSLLFTVLGFLTSPSGSQFELNRFLLRPIYLLVLGYMMAYCGGYEIKLRRQLSLLKDVTSLSNPRFGVRRTISRTLERVRAFYDADACMLILKVAETDKYKWRRADRHDADAGERSETLTPQWVSLLRSLPAAPLIVCSSKDAQWWVNRSALATEDHKVEPGESYLQDACMKLKAALNAESFVSIPVRFRRNFIGRVFLTSQRKRAFDRSDADFLIQISEQVIPVIENIQLVDHLASDAASQERQRIARDLHDSTIQPYIGLQMGLAAVRKKLNDGVFEVQSDVSHLIEMTNLTIADLRSYVRTLKENGGAEASLLPSVRRFAARFAKATGIEVEVEAESEIRINDRLGAEVFQMIAEALSNIRRHSQSAKATVRIHCRDSQLLLRVENKVTGEDERQSFRPRSITDRVEALGGQARVEQLDGITAVIAEIPL